MKIEKDVHAAAGQLIGMQKSPVGSSKAWAPKSKGMSINMSSNMSARHNLGGVGFNAGNSTYSKKKRKGNTNNAKKSLPFSQTTHTSKSKSKSKKDVLLSQVQSYSKRMHSPDVPYILSDGNDEEGGFFQPLDERRFYKIAAEFPRPDWRILRSHDGHYKVSHRLEPTHLYTSLARARQYKETLHVHEKPRSELRVTIESDEDDEEGFGAFSSHGRGSQQGHYAYHSLNPGGTLSSNPGECLASPPLPIGAPATPSLQTPVESRYHLTPSISPPVGEVRPTTLHSYGALVTLVSPAMIALYKGTHKTVPVDSSVCDTAHRKDKIYLRFGRGKHQQVCFFKAGLIHCGCGRERLFEEWETQEEEGGPAADTKTTINANADPNAKINATSVKEEGGGKGEGAETEAETCVRCTEVFSNDTRPLNCRSKFCDSCEEMYGGMRMHFYAEAPQKRINSERKRRRVISREEGVKGDVHIQECGPDCPICPRDFVAPIVDVPDDREDKTQGPVYGDLEKDGFVVYDLQTSYLTYEDLAKVGPPFKDGKQRSTTKAWQIIFNNEDSTLIGGPSNTKKAGQGSRRQMALDLTTNPSLFTKVGPSINMLAHLCDHISGAFAKQLAHDEDGSIDLRVMNPVFLHTEVGCQEQDAHRDWKRSACIGEALSTVPARQLMK